MLGEINPTIARAAWPNDPMAPLLDDHAMARAVLEAMENGASREQVGAPVQVRLWQQVESFFDDYFDAVHHPKEEELLVPMLHRAGFAAPHSPVARMQQEHEQMLPYRQHLACAVRQRDPGALRATVRAFTHLHRRHMALEELQVFPMARAMLGSVSQRDLHLAFLALDRDAAAARRSHARALVTSILAFTTPSRERQEEG